MTAKTANITALFLLCFMLGLSYFSLLDDSAIMDEVAHLPAGYSYISQMDMRLNPEHPPLVKDLAGGAIWLYSKIFNQPINFPDKIDAWQKDINGQWDFGFNFMYQSGNDADLMLLLGRLPMLLILLLLGFYVFKWTREIFGQAAGLLALFLYSFSPTLLTHGRFVTTDVAAAAGIFITSYYFIRWLKNSSVKNLMIAGLIFGVAQLSKFSVFLLIPLFIFTALIWIWLQTKTKNAPTLNFWPATKQYLGGALLLFIIGYVFIVWPVYGFHIANYPIAKQQSDTQFILQNFQIKPLSNFTIWLAGVPIFRALAYYGLGLAMVLSRATGGNTIYFLGQVINLGSPIYFPLLYLIKETISLHILTLIALIAAAGQFVKRKLFLPATLFGWLKENIALLLSASFIAFYWHLSVKSPLNIGVRHVLPTFPFIFMLVGGGLACWLKNNNGRTTVQCGKYILAGGLALFQIFNVVSVYPSFLTYFNELAGGPQNGYHYVTDSNLDWGQDLKRLSQWTDKNGIRQIYVDYFGGGAPNYYLKEKFLPWHCHYRPSEMTQSRWLAISGTFLQIGRGDIAFDYDGYAHCYDWLNDFQPTAVIGHSIFIYQITAK